MKSIILYTDGASKGNPGLSGIGGALYRLGEPEPYLTYAEPIADTTNNVAEYKALLHGLREALLSGADEIEIRTDSELMARQLSGRYKVAAPQIQPLHTEALSLINRFDHASIRHVPREQNALADKLANQGVASRSPKSR